MRRSIDGRSVDALPRTMTVAGGGGGGGGGGGLRKSSNSMRGL